jgi:hypothetical protein
MKIVISFSEEALFCGAGKISDSKYLTYLKSFYRAGHGRFVPIKHNKNEQGIFPTVYRQFTPVELEFLCK